MSVNFESWWEKVTLLSPDIQKPIARDIAKGIAQGAWDAALRIEHNSAEYCRGRDDETAARATIENAHIKSLKEQLAAIPERFKKLQAFKDYVHKRLDDAGIEKEPNGEHSKQGCRIGDRLDIVLKFKSELEIETYNYEHVAKNFMECQTKLEEANNIIGGALVAIEEKDKELAAVQLRLDDVNVKDSVKTREINVLTQENRDLREWGLPVTGFYLQDSRNYVGNDMLWWAKEGCGYTTDLRNAHVFLDVTQVKNRSTDIFWPVESINKLARPTVDMQYAKRFVEKK